MAKRKKKSSSTLQQNAAAELLAKALAKRKKSELLDTLVKIAASDGRVMRDLELKFAVKAPPQQLVVATRRAIADATDFDEREINYNFSYDHQAYSTVERNFHRLIEQGHLRGAMDLSLELMEKGSYQVEMSDEGMMTDELEDCLRVVIKGLKKTDLPSGDVIGWCDAMAKKDSVGFICDAELKALRKKFASA